MLTSYDRALAIVFQNEGGWVDNPHDPGGETNLGITQRVFTAFRLSKNEPRMSVRRIDKAEAALIYRAQYADAIHFDDLPAGVDLCVLDEAVNSGPVRAIKDLQRAVNVTADGHLGVLTLQAARMNKNPAAIINHMCEQRLGFLRSLKTWKYFGKGWFSRVEKVREAALRMVR